MTLTIYGSAIIARPQAWRILTGVNVVLYFPRWRLSRHHRRIHIGSSVLTRTATTHVADVGSIASNQQRLLRGCIDSLEWLFSIARSPSARNHAVYQRKLLAFAASRTGSVASVADPRACLCISAFESAISSSRGFPGRENPTRDLYAGTSKCLKDSSISANSDRKRARISSQVRMRR